MAVQKEFCVSPVGDSPKSGNCVIKDIYSYNDEKMQADIKGNSLTVSFDDDWNSFIICKKGIIILGILKSIRGILK